MQALRAKRAAEQLAEDAAARINELNNINISLSATRSKLEQELAAYAADYEEASKELKVICFFPLDEQLFLSLQFNNFGSRWLCLHFALWLARTRIE